MIHSNCRKEYLKAPEFLVQHDYMEREAYVKGRFCNEHGFENLNSLFNPVDDSEEVS